jgi:four helix bundle protein
MEHGYKKLDIFKLSFELAIRIHKMTLNLPKFELYEEGSHIRRSSKSIPSNIVEGYCLRRHKNEYLQYLHRAFGSSQETLLHLDLLFETQSLPEKSLYTELHEKYDHLGRMIFRFIESVSIAHLSPKYIERKTNI